MPKKRYLPEQIIAKLRKAEILLSQGNTVAQIIKALEVYEVTHYHWRKDNGGTSASQARCLKYLEKANTRLRKAVSDLTINKLILEEAAKSNL